MTEKQIDNLFWDSCHYGKIIKVEDFTFENEEIYISIAVIEYEGKKNDITEGIKERCGWIAPVSAYPGEFEMEAMAAGAIRVLNGEESLKKYSGKKVFEKFDFE